jgi:hypothetical protein
MVEYNQDLVEEIERCLPRARVWLGKNSAGKV